MSDTKDRNAAHHTTYWDDDSEIIHYIVPEVGEAIYTIRAVDSTFAILYDIDAEDKLIGVLFRRVTRAFLDQCLVELSEHAEAAKVPVEEMTPLTLEEFAEHVMSIAREEAGKPFEPSLWYNVPGRSFEYLATSGDYFGKWIDGYLTIFISRETGAPVGCELAGITRAWLEGALGRGREEENADV